MKSESSWSPPHRESLLFPLLLLSALITTRVAATLAYATPLLILLLKFPVQKGTPSAGIAAQVVISSWSVRLIFLLASWYPVPNLMRLSGVYASQGQDDTSKIPSPAASSTTTAIPTDASMAVVEITER